MSKQNPDQHRKQDEINNVADEAETAAAASEAMNRQEWTNEVIQPIQQQRNHPYASPRNSDSSRVIWERDVMGRTQYLDNHFRSRPSTLPPPHPANIRADGTAASQARDYPYAQHRRNEVNQPIQQQPRYHPYAQQRNCHIRGGMRERDFMKGVDNFLSSNPASQPRCQPSQQQVQEIDTVLRLNTVSQPNCQPCPQQVQHSCQSQVQEQHLLQPHQNAHFPYHVPRIPTQRQQLQTQQQVQQGNLPNHEPQVLAQHLLQLQQVQEGMGANGVLPMSDYNQYLQSHFQPPHSSYTPPPQQQRPRLILPQNPNLQFHRPPQNQNQQQQHLIYPIVTSRQDYRAIRPNQTVTVANCGGSGAYQLHPPVVSSHNQFGNQEFMFSNSDFFNQPVHMNSPTYVQRPSTGVALAPVREMPGSSHPNKPQNGDDIEPQNGDDAECLLNEADQGR